MPHKGESIVSADAKCPYYLRHDQSMIMCEGVIPDTKCKIVFKNAKSRKEHMRLFCEDLECFKICEAYTCRENNVI